MEKKRQKIWTAIGVGIAIALLLYWLTLAIWIDDDTDPPMPPPVLSKPGKKRLSLGKKKQSVASVEPKSPVWKS